MIKKINDSCSICGDEGGGIYPVYSDEYLVNKINEIIDLLNESFPDPPEPPKPPIPDLLPCPFCGEKANVKKDDLLGGWVAFCANKECMMQVRTKRFETELEAVEEWNRRAYK